MNQKIFSGHITDQRLTAEIISAEGRNGLEKDQITDGKGIWQYLPEFILFNLKSGELKSYSRTIIIK